MYILTSKCDSGHNCVPFFDMSSPKNGLDLRSFLHFHFHMRFAPQRPATFIFFFFFFLFFSTSHLPPNPTWFDTFYFHTCFMDLFDISISKSGLKPTYFAIFDLQMCFAPQRRALFRHLNFEKWSEPWCFQHFHFQMCFAPQRRANFHLSSGRLSPHLLSFDFLLA